MTQRSDQETGPDPGANRFLTPMTDLISPTFVTPDLIRGLMEKLLRLFSRYHIEFAMTVLSR